ncbi:MAG: hypothetical protein EP330_27035 [Deltaproteobacteria bacterium]|nr:MAG: hypothetical protein EP330_27035 [Deltaproteobacteria bacterium]
MTRLLAPVLALAALSACVPVEEDPAAWADLLPDERLLVSMPADTTGARGGAFAEYYLLTANVTRDVNGLIGAVVTTLDFVTDLPPTWSDTDANTAVWGPFGSGLDPAETVLFVTHETEEGLYSWVIGARPRNTEDEWTPIVVGQVGDDGTHEDHEGWFAFDFDAAAELDPTMDLRGRFVSEYAVSVDGVSASAAFEDFSEAGNPPGDAVYVYEQDPFGEGSMDLGVRADIGHTALEELLVIRSRWTPEGAGRADVIVTEGDLGSLVGSASECWDEHFARVFYADSESWNNPVGDAGSCVFEASSFAEE